MDSRATEHWQAADDNKQSQLQPQTRPSTTFRSSGREKSPHWTNRFRKDFNDLEYDVKYSLIKGKDDINNKGKYQKQLRDSRRSRSSRSSEGKISGMSLQKYQKRVEMIKMNKISNPQRFNLAQKKMYSTLDTQGLCKFQFQKTIGGRLVYKSNHHLGFQHQTHRSINLNNVWYNPENEIDTSKMFQRRQLSHNLSRVNNKSHPFESYSARKVFEPREQLDKFYDTEKSLRLASARTIKEPCKIDDLVGRKMLVPPRSASLSYNEYEAKRKIMAKICTYPVSEMKRQLRFTRQVISPQRGCYR